MALSGQTAAIVDDIAQDLGLDVKDVARNLGNYSYLPQSVSDGNSDLTLTLTFNNLQGFKRVDWGDGSTGVFDSGDATAEHTYAEADTYTWSVKSLGRRFTGSQAVTEPGP